MWYTILGFFQLILGNPLRLTLNIIDKNLKVFEIFPKKDFKLW